LPRPPGRKSSSPLLLAVLLIALGASSSRADYLHLNTLVVIYPESFARRATSEEIERARGAVASGVEFFWDHSRMRLFLQTDRLVIERTLARDQLRRFDDGRYWLGPEAADGVHSVGQDLLDRGLSNDAYDVVVVFYAWKNGPGQGSRYGGASRPAGTLLGRAAYVAIPLAWSQDQLDRIFRHEMLHVLGSIFKKSGSSDFPEVHNREAFEILYGRGTDRDWHSWILDSLPSGSLATVGPSLWGRVDRFLEEPGYGLGGGLGRRPPSVTPPD
jgi:hypothetical protein